MSVSNVSVENLVLVSDVNEPDISNVNVPEANNNDTQSKKTDKMSKSKKSELNRLLTPTVLRNLKSITSNVDSNSHLQKK